MFVPPEGHKHEDNFDTTMHVLDKVLVFTLMVNDKVLSFKNLIKCHQECRDSKCMHIFLIGNN